MKTKLLFLTTVLASGTALANADGNNKVYFDTQIAHQCGVSVTDESGTIGDYNQATGYSAEDDPASADIINNARKSVTVSTTVDYQEGSLTDEDKNPLFNWTVVDTKSGQMIDSGILESERFAFDVPRVKNATNIEIYVNQNGEDKLTAGTHIVQFSMNVVCAGS
ncbi:hypothetical protein ACE1OE_17010 [Vibrio sp. E150_011]